MDFVDAPVSGRVWASEEARLIVMQGEGTHSCERANRSHRLLRKGHHTCR